VCCGGGWACILVVFMLAAQPAWSTARTIHSFDLSCVLVATSSMLYSMRITTNMLQGTGAATL
jgi:hypothetical protein